MKKLNLLLITLLGALMFSCQSQQEVSEKEKNLSRIDTLEYQIYQSETELEDDRKPREVLHLYKWYADNYPADSLTEAFLFKAAQVELGIGESLQSIQTLDRILDSYPESEMIPSILQFKAFILDDRLGRYNKAREVLDQLIENYPDHELTEGAKAYRATLGKNPEEIIQQMKAID